MSKRAEKAAGIFNRGFNCAQATLCAFAEDAGLDEKTALLLGSSFGGGMGMQDICGALTGMFMAAGMLRGFSEPDRARKSAHQAFVRELAELFRRRYGAIACRDLLKLAAGGGPSRDGARPCVGLVEGAVGILEERLEE